MGDEHTPPEQLGQLRQDLLGRRRGVDHPLRDPREALNAPRERPFRPDKRVECVVELASTHEHRADLGQLAEVAREPVRLGVDGEELRTRQRLVAQSRHEPVMEPPRPDGMQLKTPAGAARGEAVLRAP